jgi:hypothetical protein
MPLAVRSPVSDAARKVGSGCQEGRHLFLDQLILLHRGGENDLRELVGSRLPVRLCVAVVLAGFSSPSPKCRSGSKSTAS